MSSFDHGERGQPCTRGRAAAGPPRSLLLAAVVGVEPLEPSRRTGQGGVAADRRHPDRLPRAGRRGHAGRNPALAAVRPAARGAGRPVDRRIAMVTANVVRATGVAVLAVTVLLGLGSSPAAIWALYAVALLLRTAET